MGLPPFHAMGIMLQLIHPLATGAEIVVFAPRAPAPPAVAHPQNVYEVAKLARCTALLALPSFIEAWSHAADAVAFLQTLTVLVRRRPPHAPVC